MGIKAGKMRVNLQNMKAPGHSTNKITQSKPERYSYGHCIDFCTIVCGRNINIVQNCDCFEDAIIIIIIIIYFRT